MVPEEPYHDQSRAEWSVLRPTLWAGAEEEVPYPHPERQMVLRAPPKHGVFPTTQCLRPRQGVEVVNSQPQSSPWWSSASSWRPEGIGTALLHPAVLFISVHWGFSVERRWLGKERVLKWKLLREEPRPPGSLGFSTVTRVPVSLSVWSPLFPGDSSWQDCCPRSSCQAAPVRACDLSEEAPLSSQLLVAPEPDRRRCLVCPLGLRGDPRMGVRHVDGE